MPTKTPGVVWGKTLEIIGTIIWVGGIVLGVSIGGWAGFGVAALLFLLGIGISLIGSMLTGSMP